MGRLNGKVALITGGARGQGAAEGKRFRVEGAEVYLTDVLVDEGIETAAEIGAKFIEHDVTDSAGMRGSGGAFAYGASKWAVRGMTTSAAQELSPHGIRVNSIHPGIIDTAMVDEFSHKGINESVLERIPMGHYADASEVANLALFLASDESSYCSGSEFVIDGAMTA
jgi:3alpha(or 20beta)-hydroxysteroid dehydrogenase